MKTKITILLLILSCMAATNVVRKRFGLPEAKVTVRVVDESGVPLSNVDVWLGFEERTDPGRDVAVRGVTDGDGLFTGRGYCSSVVGTDIRKEGYYIGWAQIKPFREHDNILNRWLPWNPVVTTILRPIGDPTPMYAKSAWIEVPVVDQACGYDLKKGDWVSPYGTGEVSDLIFKLNRRYVSIHDLDMSVEISFSNVNDGIQEIQLPEIWRNSKFKWPREAPSDGYTPSLISSLSLIPKEKNRISANDKQMYFFRVRSEARDGKLTRALYGKIQGGLSLSPLKTNTCKVKLTYYLNPIPMNRNMEWKVRDNLLQLKKDRRGNNLDEPKDP